LALPWLWQEGWQEAAHRLGRQNRQSWSIEPI